MKTLGTGNVTAIPVTSDSVGQVVFAAATGQAIDTPTGCGLVRFSSDVNFWVRYGSTAASIPSGSSTASSTNAELITAAGGPQFRNLTSTTACTGFSVISATTGFLTMGFYNR